MKEKLTEEPGSSGLMVCSAGDASTMETTPNLSIFVMFSMEGRSQLVSGRGLSRQQS